MASIGKSAHLIDESNLKKDLLYPYPIGKTYQSYGSLTILALIPFINLPFNHLRIAWMLFTFFAICFLTSQGLRHLKMNTENIFTNCCLIVTITSLYLILSGPLNLLIERGQLEIIIPLLLFFVWKNYRNNTQPILTGVILGIAIHIKLWPCILLLLFIEKKNRTVLFVSLAAWIIPYFLLNHWLPLRDLMQSTSQYSNAASEMVGWANISLHSLLSLLPYSIPWKLSTGMWLLSLSIIIVYIHATIMVDSPEKRDLLFSLCIFGAFLAPGFMCDYVLAIILVLIPVLSSARLNYFYAIVLAILFSNLLFFGMYAGTIKAFLLFISALVSIAIMLDMDLTVKAFFCKKST